MKLEMSYTMQMCFEKSKRVRYVGSDYYYHEKQSDLTRLSRDEVLYIFNKYIFSYFKNCFFTEYSNSSPLIFVVTSKGINMKYMMEIYLPQSDRKRYIDSGFCLHEKQSEMTRITNEEVTNILNTFILTEYSAAAPTMFTLSEAPPSENEVIITITAAGER